MRVGLIHLARQWDSRYSLASVIRGHLAAMAGDARIELAVLAPTGLARPDWLPPHVAYEATLPLIYSTGEGEPPTRAEVGAHLRAIITVVGPWLRGLDVVMLHDLLVHNFFKLYKRAFEIEARAHPSLVWCHFMHASPCNAATASRQIWRTRFKNARFVCLAPSLKEWTATAANVPETKVHVLSNTLPVTRLVGLSAELQALVDIDGLLQADVAILHAFPLSRRANKQPHHVLAVASALKARGLRVRVLMLDFRGARDNVPLQQKMTLRWLGSRLGLSRDDLHFVSDRDPKFRGVAQEDVMSLLRLTNVFVHPSTAEACPLIALEAAAASNLCVVNERVSAFRDLLGEHALYHDFKPLFQGMEHESAELLLDRIESDGESYARVADAIALELRSNPVLAARRRVYRDHSAELCDAALVTLALDIGGRPVADA